MNANNINNPNNNEEKNIKDNLINLQQIVSTVKLSDSLLSKVLLIE